MSTLFPPAIDGGEEVGGGGDRDICLADRVKELVLFVYQRFDHCTPTRLFYQRKKSNVSGAV